MSGDVLQVDDLTTHIFTDAGVVRAVENVSLRVAAGEAVALVGESGCGKSITAMSILRLIRPPVRILGGSIRLQGVDLTALSDTQMRAVRGGRIGMIFQDPMTYLNPVMRIGDQIVEAVQVHQGIGRRAAAAHAVEVLAQVGIPSPEIVFAYYPHQLSGGMRQRVLIAIAVSCRPAMLIADEPTTALDVTIQAQIMHLLGGLRRSLGSGLLLITHDLGLVAQHCDRVYVMYAGRIVEEGDIMSIFRKPRHPYTEALLRSTLSVEQKSELFEAISGQPPSLVRPPEGCRFNPRCGRSFTRCLDEEPPLFTFGEIAQSRCWLAEPKPSAG